MGIKGREDLRLSAEVRTAFEMLLIRMLVFSPGYVEPTNLVTGVSADSSTTNESTSATESEKKKNKLTAEVRLPQQLEEPESERMSDELTGVSSEAPTDIEAEQSSDTEHDGAEVPSARVVDARREKQLDPEEGSESDKLANAASTGAITLDSLSPESWLRLYPQLEITGIAANVLANSDFQRADSNTIHFVLDHSQSAVFSDELLPKISQALSSYFAIEVSVQIEIADAKNETPAMLSQRVKQEKHVALVNDFESDENVQELLKHFSGTLAKETIAPNKD
jgi:DNA polymerase-3 subunit gamma/tau